MAGQDHLAQVTKRLKTSSAVVPALLLSVICVPIGALGLRFAEERLDILFGALIVVPPLLAALQIVFFTFADRDRLQNEDHVERKMLLRTFRPEIGDARSVLEISGDQSLIANPSAKDGTDV